MCEWNLEKYIDTDRIKCYIEFQKVCKGPDKERIPMSTLLSID